MANAVIWWSQPLRGGCAVKGGQSGLAKVDSLLQLLQKERVRTVPSSVAATILVWPSLCDHDMRGGERNSRCRHSMRLLAVRLVTALRTEYTLCLGP